MGKIGSADVALQIKQDILDGVLKQNQRLSSSRELAATYGVARNTLRVALDRLEAEGLVEIRPNSGTFVIYHEQEIGSEAIHGATPLELIDARFALEPHICRLCVLYGRREDFNILESLCDRMESAINDPADFSRADTDFHLALAKTSRNGILNWVIDQITSVRAQDQWTRMRNLTLNEEMIRTYNLQHRNIVEALRAREPEKAANVMKTHLESARISLMRVAEA